MATYITRLSDLRKVPIGKLVVFNHNRTLNRRGVELCDEGIDFYDAGIVVKKGISENSFNEVEELLLNGINEGVYNSILMDEIRDQCSKKFPYKLGWDKPVYLVERITGDSYNLPEGKALVFADLPLPEDKRAKRFAIRLGEELERVLEGSIERITRCDKELVRSGL
jgi:hypothetical protein